MTEQLVHVNGEILPIRANEYAAGTPASTQIPTSMPTGVPAAYHAGIGVFDRGLLYGDGLYETIRVRNGVCLRFALHANRLTRGLRVLQIPPPDIDISAAIQQLLKANNLSDARVRVTITRGMSIGGTPTVVITAVPLPSHGLDPTKAVISSYRREETSPLTRVKTLNCLASVMAGIEAHARGADDAILLNTQGNVAEATTANVFLVTGSRLITPALDQGCLPGTIRTAVLDLAPQLGLEPSEGEITPEDLTNADELILTSAIKLARPIVELNGRTIGRGTHHTCSRIRTALLADETSSQS